MMKLYSVVLIVGIFFLTCSVYPQAGRVSNHFVQASVWVDMALLEPSQTQEFWSIASRYNKEFIENLTDEERARFTSILSIIEEMRWVLSGMVYGFWFEYRPASVVLKVDEEFMLQHIGLIEMGDPNMRLVGVAIAGSWIEITFQYQLNAHQQRRILLQNNSGVVHGQGRAASSLEFGFDSRRVAITNSIKNAIHQRLRLEHRLRPGYVRGELYLRRPVVIDAKSGEWVANSDVSIVWKDVIF